MTGKDKYGRKKHPKAGRIILILGMLLLFLGWGSWRTGALPWEAIARNHVVESAAKYLQSLKRKGEKVVLELKGEGKNPCIWDEEDIPAFTGKPYVVLADNVPDFSREELSSEPYEAYTPLDSLGRCGRAQAMLHRSLMPEEKRGDISEIRPTGWHNARYASLDNRYLYNRCHLIAFALTGENANERNLITGTRYLNLEGMLPLEEEIADYVRWTGDRVLYRVTPVYAGMDLLARGVQMEAASISSSQIRFNVFVFNVQPGITLDYATGYSRQAGK